MTAKGLVPSMAITVICALALGNSVLWSGAALAQANGDPGSAMLGIAKAQTHSDEKAKSGEDAQKQQSDAKPPAPGSSNDDHQSVANQDHRN